MSSGQNSVFAALSWKKVLSPVGTLITYAVDTDAEDTDRELYGGVVRHEGYDTGLNGQRGAETLGIGTAIVLHTIDNAILGYGLRLTTR